MKCTYCHTTWTPDPALNRHDPDTYECPWAPLGEERSMSTDTPDTWNELIAETEAKLQVAETIGDHAGMTVEIARCRIAMAQLDESRRLRASIDRLTRSTS